MSTHAASTPPRSSKGPDVAGTDLYPDYLAGALSYLIPGLGQVYQGRVGKGLLFLVSLLGMFFLGQAMGHWKNVYMPELERPRTGFVGQIQNIGSSLNLRWHFAGQFWIGMAAWPAIWQYNEMPTPSRDEHPFWNEFQRSPTRLPGGEQQLNLILRESDKTPDLGWIYTVIAGVLNILVILDATIGPAYGRGHGHEEKDLAIKKEGVTA